MTNRSLRIATVLSAAARRVPGVGRVLGRCAGYTDSASYCYGVWLRHLSQVMEHGQADLPNAVAELGPGPSLGTLLAALLSGVQQGFAFDVTAHADSEVRNLRVLGELVERFQVRAPIPDQAELPDVRPSLEAYGFPDALSGHMWASSALAPERIERLRDSLRGRDTLVRYVAPWREERLLQPASVDLIFSQAVLEHVTDLSGVYGACREWLRPGGLMSHQIDFRCHGTARHWNGHLTYSDRMWSFMSAARPYLINRQPYSVHRRLLREAGFELLYQQLHSLPSQLVRSDLAPRFQDLDDSDLTTSGVYLLARRLD